MKASLHREQCRKHSSPKEEERDMEEEEERELDDKESPPRSPLLALDSGKAVSMAGERSSAGKDNGEERPAERYVLGAGSALLARCP